MTNDTTRGRGRPPTGTRVEANIPDDVIDAIDRAARLEGLSRAGMIRRILRRWSDPDRHACCGHTVPSHTPWCIDA